MMVAGRLFYVMVDFLLSTWMPHFDSKALRRKDGGGTEGVAWKSMLDLQSKPQAPATEPSSEILAY